jgi:hypothetical protein
MKRLLLAVGLVIFGLYIMAWILIGEPEDYSSAIHYVAFGVLPMVGGVLMFSFDHDGEMGYAIDAILDALSPVWDFLRDEVPWPRWSTLALWFACFLFAAWAWKWAAHQQFTVPIAVALGSVAIWRSFKARRLRVGTVLSDGRHVIGHSHDGNVITMRDVHTSDYRIPR